MKHFAGRTDKRHWAWSSSRAISRLDQGTLHRQKGAPRTDTVKRYVRKDGSTGYVGTRKLKQTETLGHVSRSCWCTSGDHRQYSFFGAVYIDACGIYLIVKSTRKLFRKGTGTFVESFFGESSYLSKPKRSSVKRCYTNKCNLFGVSFLSISPFQATKVLCL